ncbi:MAG: hypothetical protein MJ223_04040 [Mycoplasmoidaceae bacterium]|nr:hypothetical protein [Mycoplasmoidaceae bacterium]
MKIHKAPKERVKTFLLQAKILNSDEIAAIIDDCDFEIKMPNATNNKVALFITTQKTLPTKIYRKLVNFPKESLEIVINSSGVDQDYSKMGDYIND